MSDRKCVSNVGSIFAISLYDSHKGVTTCSPFPSVTENAVHVSYSRYHIKLSFSFFLNNFRNFVNSLSTATLFYSFN